RGSISFRSTLLDAVILFLVIPQSFGLPGTQGVIFWVSSCRCYFHVQSLLSFVHGWLIDWTAPLLCFSARNSGNFIHAIYSSCLILEESSAQVYRL
ncbi:hypothetical protein B0H13DRAFT_1980375, partial [Mycena leptocephala]